MNTRRTIRTLAPGALVLAGLGLGFVVSPMLSAPAAQAQPANSTVEPPFNAAGDRKAMTAALADINARLGRIEAKLITGINVRVTEMPASKDTK